MNTLACCISEVKLTYKNKVRMSDLPKVNISKDAFDLFYSSWDQDTIQHCEEFKIMLLNRANKVLGIATISKGGISGTVTDVRIILQYAIKSNASAIIVAHNHPSGNKEPSESDRLMTVKIKEAVNYMDFLLLDHLIIVPDNDFLSMTDNGMIH